MRMGLFTLFVYLCWPRRKKIFPFITATSLAEDIGQSYPQLPEKETEVLGKLLPSQRCPLLSKASFTLLQCPEMVVKS